MESNCKEMQMVAMGFNYEWAERAINGAIRMLGPSYFSYDKEELFNEGMLHMLAAFQAGRGHMSSKFVAFSIHKSAKKQIIGNSFSLVKSTSLEHLIERHLHQLQMHAETEFKHIDNRDEVRTLLRGISALEQRLLKMNFCQGLSCREISQQLKAPKSRIEAHIREAISKLNPSRVDDQKRMDELRFRFAEDYLSHANGTYAEYTHAAMKAGMQVVSPKTYDRITASLFGEGRERRLNKRTAYRKSMLTEFLKSHGPNASYRDYCNIAIGSDRMGESDFYKYSRRLHGTRGVRSRVA
jgi:RNA polymerase sigma factor (sigma-70 family)